MTTVEIEREKLDQLIRAALAAENDGVQPPEQVWHCILRRTENIDDGLAFGAVTRGEQSRVLATGVS
jgi:hypothetical protein